MSYEVGYGRPPLHTRFHKGQSGNPGGRPRQSLWFDTPSALPKDLGRVLLRELDRKMPREIAGPGATPARRGRRLTWREAIVMRLIEQSASGDLRAARLVAELMWHFEPAAERHEQEENPSMADMINELRRQHEIEAFAEKTKARAAQLDAKEAELAERLAACW